MNKQNSENQISPLQDKATNQLFAIAKSEYDHENNRMLSFNAKVNIIRLLTQKPFTIMSS